MKPNTLGEILWMIEADSMRRFDAALAEHGVSEEKRNSMRQEDFSRWYQPWPDWVLNIGAEVFDVHFPSVSKQTFISILRNIHWLIFEVKIEGESAQPPPFNWHLILKTNFFDLSATY